MRSGRRQPASKRSSRVGLPAGSPPRWPKELPRGGALWAPSSTRWTESNTDGLWTCEFASATIRLTKGRGRGELVQLRHWQGDLICDVLRLNNGGRRMYRVYELFTGRKNSKSLLGAIFALDGLFDEPGAEVYSCAGDRDQAKVVFSEVAAAVKMSPELGGASGKSGLLKVYRDAIEYPATGSVYRATSSDARLREGLNPSRVIFDEKHVQRDDELWNVMNEGSGTRDQPLVLTLTTKGVLTTRSGEPTICKRDYDRGKKLMAGEMRDPTWGCRIYETPGEGRPGFDYLDESAWGDANPALGDFLHLEDMRAKSRQLPENDFKTKRLNLWVTSKASWLPDGSLERLARPSRTAEQGETAALMLDGSYSQDSTAVVAWLCGEKTWHLTLLGLWERPEDARPDWHVPVAEVERFIIDTTRGEPVNPDDPDGERHRPVLDVRGIIFDLARWQRSAMVLEEAGLPVEAFPQSAERMVPATTGFYEAVMEGTFTHDGHPALLRHFGNATTKTTLRGTMVEKKNPRGKIDAAVAAIFGRSWCLEEFGEGASAYSTRGLLTV